jgi:hypothetical protein
MEPPRTTRPDGPPGAGRPRDAAREHAWDPFEAPGAGAGDDLPPRSERFDLSPLLVMVDALRRAVPSELQAQFTTLLREVLLTLRSLIDWYLERLDRRPREPRVEDIPID